MRHDFRCTARSRLALALAGLFVAGAVQADAFTYSGRLDEFGAPANGRYDLRLAVHADPTFGNTIVTPIEYAGVEVVDGAFRVDFDLPTGHAKAWVELAIRPAGSAQWVVLPGRTEAINAPAAIGQCWSSTGDAGSNPAINFLGTTDAQPLVLRTQNVPSLRIEPSTVLSSGNPITTNTIAGSSANSVTAGVRGATIAGGGVPLGESDPDLTSEAPNVVTDHYGAVGGGYSNRAGDAAGTTASAPNATVAGGIRNTASGSGSTVGGGGANTASGTGSVVGGGTSNVASGIYGTVGGGALNCAGGDRSWAGGNRAKVRPGTAPASGACADLPSYPGGANGDQGTFVWADSQNPDFVSSGPNQFLIRADGGLLYNTNTLFANTDDATLHARQNSGDADMDLRLVTRTGKSVAFYVSDLSGSLFISPPTLTANANRLTVVGGTGGNATLSNGGTWTNASSRTFKEGFAAVDTIDVLNRLLDLPITTWQYIGSAEGLHLGPVAEDFKAAFGLAGDGQSIATVDADGVALAAIQGLNAKLQAQNAALMARIAALEAVLLQRQGE